MTFRVNHSRHIARALLGAATIASIGCSRPPAEAEAHAGHESSSTVTGGSSATTARATDAGAIPASATTVAERLAKSPRHGEYAMIRTGPSDSVRAWVVYPERSTKAPVVVVVHEIFGLSAWVRGVADQLAADGFIAIAPDLLTGKLPVVSGTDTVEAQAATGAVRSLKSED